MTSALDPPSLSTSGETLTIEESMNLEGGECRKSTKHGGGAGERDDSYSFRFHPFMKGRVIVVQ
jgi:hypothetical protein